MEELWNLIIYNFVGVLLVFARVSGIFTFNPIFSRTNIPVRVRVMLSLALAVTTLSTMGGVTGYIPTGLLSFVLAILYEGAVGLVFGFIVNLILTVLIYAGEVIDNQIGLGMAKAMDPSTGVTMPVFANIYYYLFIIYFFITGGHLSYIKLFALSYEMLPIGFTLTEQTRDLAMLIAQYLGTVLTLAAKFAMPIVVTELIVEFCIGVMMKAVPTIQVFVVNIQVKIIVGLFVIMIISAPMSEFIEKLLGIMWEDLYAVYPMIGA